MHKTYRPKKKSLLTRTLSRSNNVFSCQVEKITTHYKVTNLHDLNE